MKHCHITQSRHISAPPDQVWAVIQQVEGMENWYPGLIQASDVTYADDGINRVCTMTNGGQLDERILIRDDKTRTFSYAIDAHPLPAQGVVGTLRVDDLGGSAHVSWSAQFTVADDDETAVTEMVNAMYAVGLESLENFTAAQS